MSKIRLYFNLAKRNFAANKRLNVPLILAASTLILVYAVLNSKVASWDSGTQRLIATLGSIIILVFAFIFISFARSFILKQRSKEMGLYATLGLGKGEFIAIYFIELVFTLICSLVVGILLALPSIPLANYLLQRVVDLPLKLSWGFSMDVVIEIIIRFSIVFVLGFIPELRKLLVYTPKQLFERDQPVFREFKGRPILFVLGVGLLGGAYYLSSVIGDADKDIVIGAFLFMLAVIMVIVGTYLFYLAVVPAVLKFLKNRDSYYHKPENFIKISALLSRLVAHARGLADITILSCMILMTMFVTIHTFRQRPEATWSELDDLGLYCYSYGVKGEEDLEVDSQAHRALMKEKGLEFLLKPQDSKKAVELTKNTVAKVHDIPEFEVKPLNSLILNAEGEKFYLVLNEDLNKFFGEQKYQGSGYFGNFSTLKFHTKKFAKIANLQVAELERQIPDSKSSYGFGKLYLHVPKDQLEETLDRFLAEGQLVNQMGFNTALNIVPKSATEFSVDELKSILGQLTNEDISAWHKALPGGYRISSIYPNSDKIDHHQMKIYMAAFLYLGIICSLTFFVGLSVISWFKQYSEAEVERSRVQIMEEIGLPKKIIRKSVNSQIYWLFLLPLFVAYVHCLFGYSYIKQLFSKIFYLTVDNYILRGLWQSFLIAAGILFVGYFLIYKLATKAYWRSLQINRDQIFVKNWRER
ncbi:MAG: ABC transporter permease [Eubacteriales bacterium]|nr:ABC transporter permease [Eubacteriales bacterium]